MILDSVLALSSFPTILYGSLACFKKTKGSSLKTHSAAPLPTANLHTHTQSHTLKHTPSAMEIGIVDHGIPDDSHDFYDVYFYSDRINTMVTHDPSQVSRWLSHTQRIHRRRLNNLIVGLDVEWRPSFSKYHKNPVATLQLCVGRRCLVFQILLCAREYEEGEFIPEALRDFLADEGYTFVGVGIQSDVQKLEEDYGLEVSGRIVDLRRLAADEYDRKELRNAGMKELARLVLGREFEKPRWLTMGRWDSRWLNPDQVQYACVDAFVSFAIGRRLDADECQD